MAAAALMVGADPWLMLTTRSQTELSTLEAIVDRAIEMQDVRDRNLAVDIANKLQKVLGL